MYSLLNNTIRTYIWLGILLYAILFVYWENSFSYYNVLNFFTFSSYAFVLWISANWEECLYNSKQLSIIVLFYSLIFVWFYQDMSFCLTGNTYMFSVADSKSYDEISDNLLDLPTDKWIPFLAKMRWNYDDWGSPFFQTYMKCLFPSRYFVNFIYIVLGVCSANMLFSIGKRIMQVRNAYYASLSYAIASFAMYFYGTYLKEVIMVFVVILCYWIYYKYRGSEKKMALMLSVSISLLLFFFRPVVAMFIWLSFFSSVLFKKGKGTNFIFILLVLIVIGVSSIFAIQDASRNYIHDGDLASTANYVNASRFGIITSSISAFVGPFPNLLQISKIVNPTAIFGSGLLFKMLLVLPFYKGLVLCLRNKDAIVMPLFVFCIVEMLALAVVNDGLELRKAYPHVALFFMASFWFISKYDENVDEEILQTKYYKRYNLLFYLSTFLIFGITLAWSSLRVL